MKINKGIKLTHTYKNGLNRESSAIKNFETILGDALYLMYQESKIKAYRSNYKENGTSPFNITHRVADYTRFIKYLYPMNEDKSITYDMIIDISDLYLPEDKDIKILCDAIKGEFIEDYLIPETSELFRVNYKRRLNTNKKYQVITEKEWLAYAKNS